MTKEEEEQKEKIKRAIWMHNWLIDKSPDQYIQMKGVYERELRESKGKEDYDK